MLRSLPLLLLAPLSVLTRPTPSSSSASSSSVSLLYEFSEQRLENMAARSNGHLALTVVNQPQLYDFDPTASSPTPNLLHQFPDATSLAGIAETAPDVFAVVVGNQSSAGLGVAGSFSVWSVNLNTPEATVDLITTIPDAEALNGMTTVSGGSSDIVLIADSSLGAVWRVNVASGDYSIAIQDSHFTNSSTARGINGVHVSDGELYFTNSAQESYGHVPITGDGSANGDVEVYGIPAGSYDDFAFDSEGNSWIATHPGSVTEWSTGGSASDVTGGGMEQPTSVKFGRGSTQEESTLYMVTYGNPESGGGQIFAIST